jgi:hypothetical protein
VKNGNGKGWKRRLKKIEELLNMAAAQTAENAKELKENRALFDLLSYLHQGPRIQRRERYQDPQIQVREKGRRPHYVIRPYVTVNGVGRKQKRIVLGYTDQISLKEAKAKKKAIMAGINNGKPATKTGGCA